MGNITQRVVAINDLGLQERTRVNAATGKESVRFAVSINSTPLLHDLNTKTLGEGPAKAIAEHLRKQVKGITVAASPDTIARRERAEAVLRGRQTVQFGDTFARVSARYSGGRPARTMLPNSFKTLFNDSGRFADGIAARSGNSNEWVINVPANRLDPKTLDGVGRADSEAALRTIYAKLIQLVPEFGDPVKLMRTPEVAMAIVDGWKRIVMRGEDLRLKESKLMLDTLKNALQLVF